MPPNNIAVSILIYTPQGPAEFRNIRKLSHAKSWIDFVAEDGRRIVTTMPYFLQQGYATQKQIVIPGAA